MLKKHFSLSHRLRNTICFDSGELEILDTHIQETSQVYTDSVIQFVLIQENLKV